MRMPDALSASKMLFNQLATDALRYVPWSLRKRVSRTPLVGALQRWYFAKLINECPFVHEVDAGPAKGVKFEISLPEDKGIWTGCYEQEFAMRLASAASKGGVAYDIGGWHGYFAAVMAVQGAREVHVFEPLPANARHIERLLELNSEYPIQLHRVAIASHDTVMNLLITKDPSMAKLEVTGSDWSRTTIPVVVRSIDSIVKSGEARAPDLIKIDVEGAELFVLQGARETIRSKRPDIFAEIHSPLLLHECEEFLETLGYGIERLDETGPVSSSVFQIRAIAQSTRTWLRE